MKESEKFKLGMFQAVLIAAIGILVIILMRYQLLPNRYRLKAEYATLDKTIKEPARGLIFDRAGTLLVSNGPVYDLRLSYQQIDRQMDTSFFCSLLDIDRDDFVQMAEKDWSSVRYDKNVPFVFLSRVPEDKALRFQEFQFMFPGFEMVLRSVRAYHSEHAAHVLGYINEVDQEDLENAANRYARGDYIGASGIELQYEDMLRGSKGIAYELKDKYGRNLGSFNQGVLDSAARSGEDIILGLDIEIQAYAEMLLQGKKGSVVAIEPSTGDILCMASAPHYSPDLLSMTADRGDNYDRLAADSSQPFFNRAIMARYPPGSIIKPVLSLIALQEGLTSENEVIECYGSYDYRHFSYGCHDHNHRTDLRYALETSCNSYFFDLYRRILEQNGFAQAAEGYEGLRSSLRAFGLGDQLSLDLPGEKSGFLPEVSYYDKLYGAGKWRSTYTISLGIGQGEIELTTLQMANLASIIANRGHYHYPHMVKSFAMSDGTIEHLEYPTNNVGIEYQHFLPVIDGMERAVISGTSTSAAIKDIEVCGKTGTSQNPHGKDHSVFFAFAPKRDPKIAIAVYIENGGWGATYAAPIAGLVMEKYLKGSIDKNKVWLEQRILQADLINDKTVLAQ